MATTPSIGVSPPECGPAVDCVSLPQFEQQYLPTINRVFVIGDRIVTLSDVGIATHDANSFARTGFAAF